MGNEKIVKKAAKPVTAALVQPPPAKTVPVPPVKTPPLFRRIDWLTFGIATLLVFIGYYLTLAPEVTLEDSGELTTGSFYAGIPHPPGYPFWAIYSWLWTVLLPIGNVAWRVEVGEAAAAAMGCGFVALMVSRGSSMLMEGIEELNSMTGKWENAICAVCGVVAGLMLGYGRVMWSESVVINRISLFGVPWMMLVLLCLMRWIYAPHQRRYLYMAMFFFGICATIHQTLLCATMGIEALIIAVDKRIGRDLLMGNTLVFLGALFAIKEFNAIPTLSGNGSLYMIFSVVGWLSVGGFAVLIALTCKKASDWIAMGRDVTLLCCVGYLLALVGFATELLPSLDTQSNQFKMFHGAGLAMLGCCIWLTWHGPKREEKSWLARLYMPLLVISAVFGISLMIMSAGADRLAFLKTSLWGFWSYMFPGLGAVTLFFWLATRRRELGSNIKVGTILGVMWFLGASFYFYEAIAGMTCPPMQWGYPRTVEGFFHALSRGQYGQSNPTDVFQDPNRFIMQLGILVRDISEEFNWLLAVVALVPLLFFFKMQKRERAWIIGLVSTYLCVGVLLTILMNTSPDRQSSQLNKVFFITSHGIIAVMIGSGLALIMAYMATHYGRFRRWGLLGGAIAAGVALYSLWEAAGKHFFGPGGQINFFELPHWIARAFQKNQERLPICGPLIMVAVPLVFLVALAVYRRRAPLVITLALCAIMPLCSGLSHWGKSEQRNHWFGYWFGHDMFTPPFVALDGKFSYDPKLREQAMKGPKGNLVYPEMTRDAILYGGTDPGRFCPTYMIFCESFIPHDQQPKQDQNFDRRDVYLITQNALADGTYLMYLRSQYNRSAQIDPPFFQELLRLPQERNPSSIYSAYTTNFIARAAFELLDKPFTKLGKNIENRRRREGVYPAKEIYMATPQDSQDCFGQYMEDVKRRLAHDMQFPNEPKQIRGGEDPKVFRNPQSGRDEISISGQTSVMAINGLLTKVIFVNNPTNEFYVEESFPLDWMFPYLTPFSVIMKINRQPLPVLTEDILQRDHEFWSAYSDRLIGNWITYDTPVKEIGDFVERVYLRRDFTGFTGDRKFIRDDDAQKSFSKLRSSIAGIYAWRLGLAPGAPTPPEYLPKNEAERQRLIKEADFAFKQAFAYCPYSPEAVYRYINLLVLPQVNRFGDALIVAETCLKLDPENESIRGLVNQLRQAVGQPGTLSQLEQEVKAHPDHYPSVFRLAAAYMQMQQPDRAITLFDSVVNNPKPDASAIMGVVEAYRQLNNIPKYETALDKLTQIDSGNAEAWYALAGLKAGLGKTSESLPALTRALTLSDARHATNTNSPDLRAELARDNTNSPSRFANLRDLPEFKRLLAPQ